MCNVDLEIGRDAKCWLVGVISFFEAQMTSKELGNLVEILSDLPSHI
jgi:hypothetical protein